MTVTRLPRSLWDDRLFGIFLSERLPIPIRREPHPLAKLRSKRALITVAEVDGDFCNGGISQLKHLASHLHATTAEKLFRREAGVLLEAPVEISMRHAKLGGEIGE